SLLSSTAPPPAPHSFPTRRSSDLIFPGPRPVPGRSAHEDTSAPGLIRSLSSNRNRCAPGRRALRSATGPRSQRVEGGRDAGISRSEEHTSELQSPYDLVCRLLLEK